MARVPRLARLSLLMTLAALVLSVLAAAPAPAAPADLLDSAPPAARRAEPALPRADGWPFSESFPRTSGTGRLAGGALLWSDFIYDDHGAKGTPAGRPIASLAPTDGTYEYPAGPAAKNGADIFRTGIAMDDRYTYWRIDWNTLIDPTVPVAAFGLDTDGTRVTGAVQWPAVPNLISTGIEKVLVSSRGAWLSDAESGERTAVSKLGGRVTVDEQARSFVVRLPRRALRPSGTWTVRLVAGLANEAGDGFLAVGPDLGSSPGQPPVYNAAFRSYRQEPQVDNFWMEDRQAAVLADGDVSSFHVVVRWKSLAERRTTREPQPTGYTNRWYVSSIEPGQGVVPNPSGSTTDLRPNYLGRVQPYAIYVPSTYDGDRPTSLTWILHSLSVQHNQYGAFNPEFIRQACEDRRSICVTTLGRGPDMWYFDEAELDFFEVWNRVASAYRLDRQRTMLSGYSMGGYGTYKLGLAYPDLFSAGVVLAGPPVCGIRVGPGQAFVPADGDTGSRCGAESDTLPLVVNAKHLPFFIAHGALDELVPVHGPTLQASEFDALDYRYRYELYPAADHLAYATADGFPSAAKYLSDRRRSRNPGNYTYTWYPRLARPKFGVGPGRAWWLRGLEAKDAGPGVMSRVQARSLARPEKSIIPQRSSEPVVSGDMNTGTATQLRWRRGDRPAPKPRIELTLTNVAQGVVDLPHAGIPRGRRALVLVRTDGAMKLRLAGLRPGTRVRVAERAPTRAGRSGRATMFVPMGSHRITVRP